ncbi:hypothetical protein F0P96_08165 [Hymenobacter busanensis]|uniref:Uncharacterized protein n=1 Tax=Hymenobacter busanensis TaxID=2607656 RepID=A0A7L5A1S7_9BACT|nr:hypothetical protein [Hymenobacter busanensis]KAA9332954.1 hypothetical protein F0P96_08165 [Hymenobacter busanensis]QHJ08372.1 hypothetical protein GUY19_14165 [Hymenobacter busanensis]
MARFSILFLLVCAWVSVRAAVPTDLLTAVQARQVEIGSLAVGGLGADNLQCRLRNLTQHELTVTVPAGLHFSSRNAETQEMMTYQLLVVTLAPEATEKVRLQGFCMNRLRHAPSGKAIFFLRGFAPQPVKQLGDSLTKYPALAPSYGQMLVWALTDNQPLFDLEVEPELVRGARNTVQYVSRQAGLPVVAVRARSKNKPATPTVKTFSQTSALLYHLPTAQVLTLKMVDPQGHVRSTLFDKKLVKPGVQNYAFGINETVRSTDQPVYFVRLSDATGRVLKEVRVDERTEPDTTQPRHREFDFRFSLTKPVKKVYFRLRLPDGTLVEEIMQRPYLPPGSFLFKLAFNYLQAPNTAFVARLESETGQVYHEQKLGPDSPK